jgi:metal-responsive CopG/Arc/MetJ family transcriptional regulator
MEVMSMTPVSEKIFVRLPKDLVTALDRYVEKRACETLGIRLTRSDAVRICLHRCLQEELHEVETMRTHAATVGSTEGTAPYKEET